MFSSLNSCFDCIALYNLCIHNMLYPAMHQVCLCKHWGNRVTRSAAKTLDQGSTKQSGGSRCRKGWRLRWVSNKLVSATPLEWCNMLRWNWINLWNVILLLYKSYKVQMPYFECANFFEQIPSEIILKYILGLVNMMQQRNWINLRNVIFEHKNKFSYKV